MDTKPILGHDKLIKLLTGISCPSEYHLKNFCPEDKSDINDKTCANCWAKALNEFYMNDTQEIIDEWRDKIGFQDNIIDRENKWKKK